MQGKNSKKIRILQKFAEKRQQDSNYQPDEEEKQALKDVDLCQKFNIDENGNVTDRGVALDQYEKTSYDKISLIYEYRSKGKSIQNIADILESDSEMIELADTEGFEIRGVTFRICKEIDIEINQEKAEKQQETTTAEFKMKVDFWDDDNLLLANAETQQEITTAELMMKEDFWNDDDLLLEIVEKNSDTFTITQEETTPQLTNAEVEIAVSNEMKGTPDYAELYGHLETKEQEDISLEADQVVAQQVVMEAVIQEEISQEQNSIQAKQIQPETAKSQETTQIEQTAVANEQVVKQDDYESPTFETERKGLRKLFGGIADFFSGKRKLGGNNQKVLNAGGDEKANTVYQERPSKEGFNLADSTNGLVPTRVGIRNTLGNIGKSLMNLFSSNKKEPDVITNQATIVDENGTVSTPDIFAVSDEVKKATIEVSKKAAQVKAEQNNQPIIPTTKKIENAHQANDGPVIE